MRGKSKDNLRKAVALLYGIRRDDGVSDELCDSFRKTVDAMTTAIEPDANSDAKESLQRATAEFQALVENMQYIRHSPTGEQVFFSREERHARDAAPQMVEYNKRLAETYARQPLNELVSKSPATDLTACASSILNTFISQSTSFEGDGVKWIPAGANGNELHVGSEVGYGFGGYRHVRAPHPSREQQGKSTLRGLRPLYDAMVKMRGELLSELLPVDGNLSVEFLERVASNRLGAAFVIACVYLLEEAHKYIHLIYHAGTKPFITRIERTHRNLPVAIDVMQRLQ